MRLPDQISKEVHVYYVLDMHKSFIDLPWHVLKHFFKYVFLLDHCNRTWPTCGTIRQSNIPLLGGPVTFSFTPSKGSTPNVTFWINATSNDYVGFDVTSLTIDRVTLWMQGKYYVQCTIDRPLNEQPNLCTQKVELQLNSTCRVPTNNF